MTAYAALAALAAGVVGCSAEDPDPAATQATAQTPSQEPSPDDEPPTDATEPEDALLDWTPVPGPTDALVTVAGDWTLTIAADGTRARLNGPRPTTVRAGTGRRISDAFLDDAYALVVAQDGREERPSVATAIDLATGDTRVLDGDGPDGTSSGGTSSGGTWALGPGTAFYATVGTPGRPRAYCLVSSDLPSGATLPTWCAPTRHGFTNARVGTDGELSLMTFDDSRPSCRTVMSMAGVTVQDGEPTPYDGPTECKAWEGVSLGAARVWNEVPDEGRIEQARAYAATADGVTELGDATSGSLWACGDAAYFSRDAGDGDPAQVLRWHPDDGLQVVYRAPEATEGFIVAPLRCGGDHLTLTALTPAGDEQVSAPLS